MNKKDRRAFNKAARESARLCAELGDELGAIFDLAQQEAYALYELADQQGLPTSEDELDKK